jgi:hypothetical protein
MFNGNYIFFNKTKLQQNNKKIKIIDNLKKISKQKRQYQQQLQQQLQQQQLQQQQLQQQQLQQNNHNSKDYISTLNLSEDEIKIYTYVKNNINFHNHENKCECIIENILLQK